MEKINTKQNIFWIIAVAIILIGGFFVWKSSLPVQELTPSTNTVSKISSDTQGALAQLESAKSVSAPADWQTYTIQTPYLAFDLKHPSNVIFRKIDASGDSGGSLGVYYDTPNTRAFVAGNYESEAPLGMSISVSNVFKTPEAYVKQVDLNASLEGYATTTFFGQTAFLMSGQGMDRYDIILFSHNDRLYQVFIQYGRPSDEIRSTFYKMLASIEFRK